MSPMIADMRIPILTPERWFECPSCPHQVVVNEAGVRTPMHQCPTHAGLDVPLVEVDTNAGINPRYTRHKLVEREDMIGGESGIRHTGNGMAVSAVRTERADGSNDIAVYPGTATATAGEQ